MCGACAYVRMCASSYVYMCMYPYACVVCLWSCLCMCTHAERKCIHMQNRRESYMHMQVAICINVHMHTLGVGYDPFSRFAAKHFVVRLTTCKRIMWMCVCVHFFRMFVYGCVCIFVCACMRYTRMCLCAACACMCAHLSATMQVCNVRVSPFFIFISICLQARFTSARAGLPKSIIHPFSFM